MKNIPILLLAAFSGAVAFAAPASTSSSAVSTKPVPVKIVAPTELPRDFKQADVDLRFTVDEHGVPHNVRPVNFVDRKLAARVVSAVNQWRFEPSRVDGRAVETEVVLPLRVNAGA